MTSIITFGLDTTLETFVSSSISKRSWPLLTRDFDPETIGLQRAIKEEITGGDANYNADRILEIFNGKIDSIFREKDQTKQVSAGLECGITLKDFADYQKKDIIEVYNSTETERTI